MATTMVLPSSISGVAFTENDIVPLADTSPIAFTEVSEKPYRLCVKRGFQAGARVSFANLKDLPAWVEPTFAAFQDMLSLPQNWDSYGAPSIQPSIIVNAFQLLASVMTANSPAPSIVPLHDGGVQFEWHRRKQDLEIVFSMDRSPEFFYRNNETREEYEGGMSRLSMVAKFIGNLA